MLLLLGVSCVINFIIQSGSIAVHVSTPSANFIIQSGSIADHITASFKVVVLRIISPHHLLVLRNMSPHHLLVLRNHITASFLCFFLQQVISALTQTVSWTLCWRRWSFMRISTTCCCPSCALATVVAIAFVNFSVSSFRTFRYVPFFFE